MPWWGDRPGTGDIVHVVDARHGNLPRHPARRARQRLAPTWFGGLVPRERMAVTAPVLGLIL
jgi:hypothetical protein